MTKYPLGDFYGVHTNILEILLYNRLSNMRRKVGLYLKNRKQLRLCHFSLLSPGLRSLRVLPPGY